MGLGQLPDERLQLRVRRQRRRRDRDVQLGLCRDHRSDCEQGAERPARNGQPSQHLRRPDPCGPGHGGRGAREVLPDGDRNYARVVAADDFQGAADATLAKQLKVKKLFILNDKEAYGAGVATNTSNAAKKLGITIVKNVAFDPKATSYAALALQIKSSGAQAVFLGGLICENGGKLIKDIRANAPNVKILAPDGFTPISADVQQSGGKAEGMYVSVAGLPNSQLPASRPEVREGLRGDDRRHCSGSVLGLCGPGR